MSENIDERDKKKDEAVETLKKVGVAAGGLVAGVALLGWGISKVFNGGEREMVKEDEGERNMMRAPGRVNVYIDRDEFEKDPSRYFRDLRKK